MPRVSHPLIAGLFVALAALSVPGTVHSSTPVKHLDDPLRFFEGRTEMVSTVKVVMKKPYRSRTIGHGRINPDGSLSLVQQVQEGGEPTKHRRWKMRQVAPGRFSGTMTDATGPVTAEAVGDRYRFRFTMKGHLAVEQWVAVLPGGTAANSNTTVKKMGMRVASSTGTIRRL